MSPITVLLADDHTVVREGFRRLLESETDMVIVGEAQTGRQTVELAVKLHPQVIVMDIAMPILNGLEATRQIRKLVPECKVLMLSAHSDDAYIEQAMACGASGFLFKQSSANTLSHAIRELHEGRTAFSSTITKRLREPKAGPTTGGSDPARVHLTSRETEVLQLIAEGKANKQTAAELGIGTKTVEKHRQSLMKKLNIHDTASLTRYAIGAGIIESGVQLSIN